MDIAIYVEGGGNTSSQKAELRQGFDGLLRDVKALAQAKRIGWKLSCCGGRQAAYNAFINALNTNPDVVNILLIDSEEPAPSLTRDVIENARLTVEHLRQRDNWDLSSAEPERIHLMAQCMEAWIVSDPEALVRFYGQHFTQNVLPARRNLEEEPKEDIYTKLARASSSKKITKGEYGKITHASRLLPMLDTNKISSRCPRFSLLVQYLTKVIEGI
ncbi:MULTISPECIES: DUF4276 family protein [Pectobacterium]|uniref:DUF4276 family protein n=1 Tax=Pectobacterium TaxID=122277 RepID=UPI0015DDDB1F|nr:MULTISPECIES: DUF4276 family protein [Pectobacterium]MBA0188567.1 DUF4276 family protein [Pectobacterium odoriferum]MCA6925553.1 DUF4276 family protein [Pectobacterium versatile]MCH5082310.1 DUF4276 family protein [Pectobacterium versatile]